MKPSVARLVHLRWQGTCMAAVVTSVSGEAVTLDVFPPPNTLIPIIGWVPQGENELQWHWPERVED